jgi:hypothetical protein
MNKKKSKLTLDQPAVYRIKVPGYPDKNWADWVSSMTIVVEDEGAEVPMTVMTAAIDQAALHGLLRRLYSLGLPLISVTCLDI